MNVIIQELFYRLLETLHVGVIEDPYGLITFKTKSGHEIQDGYHVFTLIIFSYCEVNAYTLEPLDRLS